MLDFLNIEELSEDRAALLRPPSNTRPAVWRIEDNGIRAVIKDFRANGLFYRNIFGRFLVWREAKALRKLSGLKGVPGLFRVMGGLSLVIEDIPGLTLKQVQNNGALPDGFFDDLKALVDKFHEKGMAHCDLKKAENILLGDDGRPYVIDWAASISRNEFCLPLLDMIYKRFVKDDYDAITKRKLVHSPDLVGPEERNAYFHQSLAERVVRAFRDRLRAFLKKLA